MINGNVFASLALAREHGPAIEVEIFDPATGLTSTKAIQAERPLPLWQVAILAGCCLPIGYSDRDFTCARTGLLVTVKGGWRCPWSKAA